MNGLFKKKGLISLPIIGGKKERKVSDPINVPFREMKVKLSGIESEDESNEGSCGSNEEQNTQKYKSPKPILRSASLGSWEKSSLHSPPKARRSGRFSVSPIPDSYLNVSFSIFSLEMFFNYSFEIEMTGIKQEAKRVK